VIIVNLGRDGSRAFVTGDFTDSGLTDDVAGLTNGQWLDLLHWFDFYDRQYSYIGRMNSIYHTSMNTFWFTVIASYRGICSLIACLMWLSNFVTIYVNFSPRYAMQAWPMLSCRLCPSVCLSRS